MKKRALIILIIILSLALFGCRQGEVEEKPTENYRTGSYGLVLNFIGGITKEVFEGQELEMAVEVKNEGAFPQPDERENLDAHIWVGGFDLDILELNPEPRVLNEEELEGKNVYSPKGGSTTVIISGEAFTLPPGTSKSYEPRIIATATYNYKTIASAEACIDPFPKGTEVREKVCTIEDYSSLSTGSSQGAPVAVTRVEEDTSFKNLLFKIYISNVGNGIIIDRKDVYKNPNEGYDWDKINKVRLADVTVGNRRVSECRPGIGEEIELRENEGFVLCKLSKDGISSTYTSPLNVVLEYGYSNSITTEFKVLKEAKY